MTKTFKFEIGQEVNVYDGWEQPLFQGTIKNRRKKSQTVTQSGISYTEEYLVEDKYGQESKVYDVAALGAISGRQGE